MLIKNGDLKMNEEKIVEVVNYIQDIGRDLNGWVEYLEGYDIPKLQLLKYPPINTALKNLKPKKYKFSSVFTNEDSQLFEPEDLEFTSSFRNTLEDEPLFIFSNGYGKEFLVYVGRNIIPEYIWEIDYSVPEEVELIGDTEEGEDEEF